MFEIEFLKAASELDNAISPRSLFHSVIVLGSKEYFLVIPYGRWLCVRVLYGTS